MKTVKTSLFLLLFTLFQMATAQGREVILLKEGWRFAKGNFPGAIQPKFDDSGWQTVSLPHDWAIAGPTVQDGEGDTGKLPWRGEGWYRLAFNLPATSVGKTIYLLFDGIQSQPEVYLNGKLAGKWDYGYNSFYLDVTALAKSNGPNLLTIHADTRRHDSRWYPGAGIYRKVQMILTDPIHAGIWDTQVTLPVLKNRYAETRMLTKVYNKSTVQVDDIRLEQVILNPAGQEVGRSGKNFSLSPSSSKEIEETIGLTDPTRWDLEHPVLYTLHTRIFNGGSLVDETVTPFGIRSLRFTPNNGLYLNDQRVQLKGVNLHHDQGPLGAAFYPRAMERQIEIMKSMGCNAIRTSHNMAAPELYDLCDKMGMLVFDEAFDKYDAKVDILENTDFDEFAARNMSNFVRRDRNHPCVFIWSVGNEMGDVQTNRNNGLRKMQIMINYVKKYDPTRPVTMACDNLESALLRHFDFYDVHSWNYMRRYRLARQMEPGKSVIISESGSTVSTRGYYELPLPEKRSDFSQAKQVSSFDLNCPEWADLPDEDFMWQQDEEYIAGEFVWTGFDYIGEPTPYNNNWMKAHGMGDQEASRSSYFGIVDLCGIPKDRYYLYKSYWKPEENTVHILPHWNWDPSKVQKLPVVVYTNGDCAELFLNGQSLGKQCKQPNSAHPTERFRLIWKEVAYAPGELKAVAYKEGKRIGEAVVRTAGAPATIRLSADRNALMSNGQDLSYVLLEALDKEGNACPLADNRLQLSLSGDGRIAGVGNGNPQSFDSFCGNEVRLFNGKALVILASGNRPGNIQLKVSTEGLSAEEITLSVQ
ncbi:MAG: DUF4982 domain-containing protein [Marinilabiliales bacterium]|nr:DUF4982 domain-containing protein [Marinilabiliales bacterium]